MFKALLFAIFVPLSSLAVAQTQASAGYPVTTELSDINRPARMVEKGAAYKAGLTDALIHIDPSFDAARIGGIVTAEKVRRVVAMPVPNEGLSNRVGDGTAQKTLPAQTQSQIAKVMCGGDYLSNWLADTQRFSVVESAAKEKFSRLQADLDSGWCLGVGELGLLHFNKSGTQNVIQIQYDSPSMLQVVDIVGSRGAWIQLHAEPRDTNGRSRDRDVWNALALWTQRQPALKIMLSHTGMTSAPNARKLLETFPNVYMSVKLVSSRLTQWRSLEPLLDKDGYLYEDWAQLMEAFPDRFVIGSDAKFGQEGHEKEGEEGYEHMIRKFRRMLGGLVPEVAKKIGNGNADKLFGFKRDSKNETSTD